MYPVGVFYALSRPLVARLLPSATRLATRLGDDGLVPCSGKWECGQYRRKGVIEDPRHLDRFERHEDLLLGHAISKIGNDVTYVQWGRTVFRDLDAANGRAIMRRSSASAAASCGLRWRRLSCRRARPRAGARRDGIDVGGGSPRRRQWGASGRWRPTRRIVLNGKPACVFPQAAVVWRHNRTQSDEVELPWVRPDTAPREAVS